MNIWGICLQVHNYWLPLWESGIGYSELSNSFTHCFIVACMFQIKGSSITAVDGSRTSGMSDSDTSIIKYWSRLCGSVWDKKWQYQKQNYNVCYVALFICIATNAIHLEFVPNLIFEAFIAALKHFIARRGLVDDLYSDNDSNFVAANRELKTFFKLGSS